MSALGSLAGKIVLVTGAGQRVGRAIAEGSKARRPFLPYLRVHGQGEAQP